MKWLSRSKSIIVTVGIALIFFIAFLPSLYFYRQYQTLKKNQLNVASEDPAAYVSRVGRHIVLPENETPTVLTVTDKERLSGQAFFANAKNGDKLLVYTQAKKAFLYDPSLDKIVEVGPVAQNSTASAQRAPSQDATPTPVPLRFVLYNGTTQVGFTKTYEVTLHTSVPGSVVVDRDNASRQDYETSILVDLSGSNTQRAEVLSTTLGMSVVPLPDGETKPEGADYLIILGSDKK